MNVVKNKSDKRLSLRGVKFEDAIRAFAKTPKPKSAVSKLRVRRSKAKLKT